MRRLSQEEFEIRVLEDMGRDYKIKGKYITGKDKILVEHKCTDGIKREYMVRASRLYGNDKTNCPHCFRRDNNIPLLRIPYNKIKEVSEILDKEILIKNNVQRLTKP